MHIIIIGAGRTGKHVIQSAIEDGHEVVVIEADKDVAERAASSYDCIVINADASSLDTLRQAGSDEADALIATTSDDSVNLLVIMLGRELGIKKLVSSVTDEDHIRLFKELGVNTVESPFRLNGKFLYRAVQKSSINDFMDLGHGVEIVEFHVNETAKVVGKAIKDTPIPRESRVIAIKRDEKVIVPQGSTVVEKGDVAVILTKQGLLRPLIELFGEDQ